MWKGVENSPVPHGLSGILFVLSRTTHLFPHLLHRPGMGHKGLQSLASQALGVT